MSSSQSTKNSGQNLVQYFYGLGGILFEQIGKQLNQNKDRKKKHCLLQDVNSEFLIFLSVMQAKTCGCKNDHVN